MRVSFAAVFAGVLLLVHATGAQGAPRFEISYTAAAHQAPITGRLILILATE